MKGRKKEEKKREKGQRQKLLWHLWTDGTDATKIQIHKRLKGTQYCFRKTIVKARHHSAKYKILLQYYINLFWLSSKLIA